MFHSEISKFHPTDRQDPPVQEHQFELLKIPADDHLIILKKSPEIFTEVFLQFHYICWLITTNTFIWSRSADVKEHQYVKLGLCVYLSDTTIRWKMYVYLLCVYLSDTTIRWRMYVYLLCVYLSDTTIRWKMYVYLLHKIIDFM